MLKRSKRLRQKRKLVKQVRPAPRRHARGEETVALLHIEQGRGGRNSTELIDLRHIAARPKVIFETELGKAVVVVVECDWRRVDISETLILSCPADHLSPAKSTE